MAVAGAGGWTPSNGAKLRNGRIEFTAITQNKPPDLVDSLEIASSKLLAGQVATVDVRFEYMSKLRQMVGVQ
jgi:hypothetical protein